MGAVAGGDLTGKQRQSARPRLTPGVFFAAVRRVAAGFAISAVLLPASLRAQGQPQRPDTTAARADTTDAAADTIGAAANGAPQEVASPPIPFPVMPFAPDTGLQAGTWVWSRAGLMRSAPTTLLDAVEAAPSVSGLRFGYYGAPEALSTWGSGAGGVELSLDGYVLDPLLGATVDLSRFPITAIERVSLQRGADRTRVEVRTPESAAAEPFSLVEAQAGDLLRLTVFRGLFLAPHFVVGPVSLGVERTASEGLGRNEPANVFNSWVKWAFVRSGKGLQVEYRRMNSDRGGSMPFSGSFDRSDLVLRGRTTLVTPDAVLEVFGGRSSVEDSLLGQPRREAHSEQYGARVAYGSPALWARAGVRWRSAEWLPRVETSVESRVSLPLVTVGGRLGWTDWRDAGGATATELHADFEPVRGVGLFGQISNGRIGVSLGPPRRVPDPREPDLLVPDTFAALPVPLFDRHVTRGGIHLRWRGIRLSAAAVRLRVDSVFSFGAPFDSTVRGFPGGENHGYELEGSIPLFTPVLRVEGSYVRWQGDEHWVYLPAEEGRGALVLHALPIRSGNLEILASAEVTRRGAVLMPAAPGAEEPVLELPGRFLYSAYLQIRVVSVRAFIRWENANNLHGVVDFPDRILPGQRVVYGVKWELWN